MVLAVESSEVRPGVGLAAVNRFVHRTDHATGRSGYRNGCRRQVASRTVVAGKPELDRHHTAVGVKNTCPVCIDRRLYLGGTRGVVADVVNVGFDDGIVRLKVIWRVTLLTEVIPHRSAPVIQMHGVFSAIVSVVRLSAVPVGVRHGGAAD